MVMQFDEVSYIFASFNSIFYLHLLAMIMIAFVHLYMRSNGDDIYLIDFCCYLPPNHLRVPFAHMLEHFGLSGDFNEASMSFLERATKRSGIGSEPCVPTTMHQIPPDATFNRTIEEIKIVLFKVVENLLHITNVNPENIDILVSNCSLFCPTPSITAAIINKFGFKSNIKSTSLSGMGCSAGILAINLARDLLKVNPNSMALVLSMEAVNPNGYRGQTKSMLLTNVLFRMGGVAILLSNRMQDKWRSKYELRHLVRTHMGSNDQSYRSVIQETDEDESVGVSLSRSLIHVAGKALWTNISTLAPRVLSYSEQMRYACMIICQNVWHPKQNNKNVTIPNFKKDLQHFCIHAGGRAVIDAVESNFKLQKQDMEASRMTLYRFGNTSSSSIWYELSYLEAKGRVKKGDNVLQIAFGSGFKCNSAIWRCISNPEPGRQERNCWSDMIDVYPLNIS